MMSDVDLLKQQAAGRCKEISLTLGSVPADALYGKQKPEVRIGSPVVVKLADVTPEPITWLWPGAWPVAS